MLLVRKVMGPESVEVGASVTYLAIEFNQENPSEAAKAEINWMIECDGEELQRFPAHGPGLTFQVTDDLSGKTLVAMPYANSPSRSVSVITLVRPKPEQVLHDQLSVLRSNFADILGDSTDDVEDAHLANRIKELKFALDDLLDSIGPLGRDDEGDQTAEVETADEQQRLAIIVGHTERSSGARALAPINQSEYPFNKNLALRMEQAASERRITTRTFFRDNIGINGAYQAAAAFQPLAIIELHFNAASSRARGSETLCCELHPNSRRLAEEVQQAMVRVFGRTGSANRGVKVLASGDRGYGNVSAAPDIPTVLVEPFFGSNELECRLAHNKIEDYAIGLVEAFDNFVDGN
jgi:N-acetylmuramoyl-L-alanine amidase